MERLVLARQADLSEPTNLIFFLVVANSFTTLEAAGHFRRNIPDSAFIYQTADSEN